LIRLAKSDQEQTCGYAGDEIKPFWLLMRDELLRSTNLFVEETMAPVLDPGQENQDRLPLGDHPRRPALAGRCARPA
jgi:hypothetical protein